MRLRRRANITLASRLSSCLEKGIAFTFPVAKDPWPSIEKAALRDFDQRYARADTMYRLHWAAVEARLNGQPFELPEAAIVMRRRSVEWIAGSPYDWDDVPLDT